MRCECVEQHGTAQHDCLLCGGCGFQYAGEGKPSWEPRPEPLFYPGPAPSGWEGTWLYIKQAA